MLTYEFKCEKCKKKIEVKFSIKEVSKNTTCPECQENTAYRVPGIGSTFVFKGSGFYGNDYRKE